MHPIVECQNAPNDPPALDERLYPMVTLTTKGGRSVTMTPESIFALVKHNGNPVLKTSKNIAPLLPMRFDLPQADTFNPFDPRYWYIAGLVTSGGILPQHSTHAACIHLTHDRKWEADLLHNFLDQYFEQFERATFTGRYPKTTVNETAFAVALASKMINNIAKRLALAPALDSLVSNGAFNGYGSWGEAILEKTSERSLFFLSGMITQESYAGFMAGFLAGMASAPTGRVFTHHTSRLVQAINEALFTDFGIPTELNINPHQDPVMYTARGRIAPHALLLRREHYLKVQDAGLAHWDQDYVLGGGEQAPLELVADPIDSITPAGNLPAVMICGNPIEVWKNFLFHSDFEPNEAAIELATMGEIFAEISDPAAVIANAPANMVYGGHI